MEEAIPVLRVADAVRAVAWLGYVREWEHTFRPGMPVFASISRNGAARLFLSEHTGDANRNTLVHLQIDDIAAVAQASRAEVLDKPWGREIHLMDPDGNRLRVGEAAQS